MHESSHLDSHLRVIIPIIAFYDNATAELEKGKQGLREYILRKIYKN
jgi:hypothetical protein